MSGKAIIHNSECVPGDFDPTLEDMPEVCPGCAPGVPQVVLPEVCPRCARDVPEVCPRWFCLKCARDVPQMCIGGLLSYRLFY